MRTAYYRLTEPCQWYEQLNRFLPSTIKDDQFLFKDEFGKGGFKYLKAQQGLWAQKLDFELYEDVEIQRLPIESNDFYLVDFYLSKSGCIRKSDNKTYIQNFENINLVLTSSMTSSQINVSANEKICMFNILFSRDWLLRNVVVDHEDLYEFFQSDHPIYLAENLDYKLKGLLQTIDFEANNRLTSIANIIQIIAYLLLRFNNRNLPDKNQSRIHPNDLEQLMKIREEIEDKPQEPVLLDELAKSAGMSLSKFKRLFKKVFGTTPYRHHLKNKMEKAMECLEQGSYSVSETGFVLGYSNLSQFSKAFKNQFGILPSEVQRLSVY